MVDLVQWLTAQLDDDERIARRATVRQAGGEFWTYDDESGVQAKSGLGVAPRAVPVHGEHIARHDPARVLREIDVKRQMLDRYEELRAASKEQGLIGDVTEEYENFLLRLLALPYVDRSGYREEWAL